MGGFGKLQGDIAEQLREEKEHHDGCTDEEYVKVVRKRHDDFEEIMIRMLETTDNDEDQLINRMAELAKWDPDCKTKLGDSKCSGCNAVFESWCQLVTMWYAFGLIETLSDKKIDKAKKKELKKVVAEHASQILSQYVLITDDELSDEDSDESSNE